MKYLKGFNKIELIEKIHHFFGTYLKCRLSKDCNTEKGEGYED
jgi:hypothetical protein